LTKLNSGIKIEITHTQERKKQMNEYKRISQIDAQLLNDYIFHTYGIRAGWVKIYGKRTCEALATWIQSEYDFTATAEELAKVIE